MRLKSIISLVIYCNVICLLYVCYQVTSSDINNDKRILAVESEENNTASYAFIDPAKAYKILEKIDIYEGFGDYTPAHRVQWPDKYIKYYYGTKQDKQYCEKHRAYFVEHPQEIFEGYKFLSDYNPKSVLRTLVIPKMGQDTMRIGPTMNRKKIYQHAFDFRTDIQIYFGFTYMYRRIGSEFSCTTQMSNHIPGHVYIYRKDLAAEALVEYGKKYESQPECFNYNSFFPKAWVLYKKDQCEEFFAEFNSEKYQQLKEERNIVYIKKIGADVHSGQGVDPVNEKQEQMLRKLYKDGALCGKVKKNYIMQYFVHNPLLVGGHKFDFRIYMLVASTNPLIAYYHDGFLRVSLHEYSSKGSDKSMLLTNTALCKSLFSAAKNNGTANGKTEEELRDSHLWTFDDLQEYLLEAKVVTDPNWLDNHLRVGFKKVMIHLIRMSQDSFLRTTSIYELLGLDFMLDDDLNLWFIEANIFPSLSGGSPKIQAFVVQMLKDHFEVIGGLLKSKVKRIVGYVNEVIRQSEVAGSSSSEDVNIGDVAKRIEEFRDISKNYFEPEFEPKSTNGFSKIIDENEVGTRRYSGLLDEHCL